MTDHMYVAVWRLKTRYTHHGRPELYTLIFTLPVLRRGTQLHPHPPLPRVHHSPYNEDRAEIHNNEGSNVPDPNLKGTQKWSSSLDSLLEDPGGVEAFKDFLKREYSEENLLFWLACEDFKKTEERVQMQKKAQHIYNTFLSSKASSQVNVEGQSRIGEQILKEPHPLMFEKLQEQIFNLMKYDSYGRFLKSEKFQKLQSSEESEISRPGESAPKRASRIYNT